jgi:hypothetical protein
MSRIKSQDEDLQIEVKTTHENLWSTPGQSPMLSEIHAMKLIRSQFYFWGLTQLAYLCEDYCHGPCPNIGKGLPITPRCNVFNFGVSLNSHICFVCNYTHLGMTHSTSRMSHARMGVTTDKTYVGTVLWRRSANIVTKTAANYELLKC